MAMVWPQAHPVIWLAMLLSTASVQASFWTVTSNFEYSMSVETTQYTWRETPNFYTYTETRTISPGVTPTGEPVSTSTYDSYVYDMLVIYQYFDSGAVDDSDLLPETTCCDFSTSDTYTVLVMPVTYTAPSSCPTSFTFSTYETIYAPTDVYPQLEPTSTEIEPASTYRSYVYKPTETWFLTESAAPITTESEFAYSYYIRSCSNPDDNALPTYSYSYSYPRYTPSSGGDGGSVTYEYCIGYGCDSLKVWVIVLAVVLPTLFVLGWIESWFWFRRLMVGKSALRFGTISWIMISLWVACFTRSQPARSKEDQKLLRQQWNAMSSGTAFKLWWKWGFKHKYPEEILGKYDRSTIGIVRPGQPPITQQNPLSIGYNGGPPPPGTSPGGPPPVYLDQNGKPLVSQPYPAYFEQSKEAHMSTMSMPTPPPGQNVVYFTVGPGQPIPPGAVPVPASFNPTQPPPPTNASEVASSPVSEMSNTPFQTPAQPYIPPQQYAGSPPPPGPIGTPSPQQYAATPMPSGTVISPSPPPTNVSEVSAHPVSPAPQAQGAYLPPSNSQGLPQQPPNQN
ncbi:hypothetical protein CC78DRAFT_536377 [Lojkania enalia]|uniref:Uncharacterized protein n=1 Tax=Lojkania enalia TaxID=147567 RepID=A0A9P4N0I2_9PLEO|nr:hypothetical protein CC78DRAFT_536377 [Didymosphaeria enalia]